MTLAKLIERGLPLNRQESYFTQTVLAMLLCSDDFRNFGLITELAGVGNVAVDASPEAATIEFFSGYAFVDSLRGPARTRFGDAPRQQHEPSILAFITQPRMLIAIEAIMFAKPSREELDNCLLDQATVIDYIAGKLGVAPSGVVHMAVLPAPLADEIGSLGIPVLRWQQIAEAYEDVGPDYFVEMIKVALSSYEYLAAALGRDSGAAVDRLDGRELYRRYVTHELGPPWMRREGGVLGANLKGDIDTGNWRTNVYECRTRHLRGNKDWFTVADFVSRVQALDPSAHDQVTADSDAIR